MYQIDHGRTIKSNDEGQATLLANFSAWITKEIRYQDGQATQTYLTIEGELPGDEDSGGEPIPLPPVEVEAEKFAGMSWVMQAWGVRCVIQPGSGIKDDLRTAIQTVSKPAVTNIYRHLGWTRIAGELTYLHAKGGITKQGNDPSIQVAVPPELARFSLDKPSKPEVGWRATIGLLDLAPPEVIWPLLAGTFAPLFGPVDFALHVTGRTGTFKSELMSLMQSHYGKEMDARHLPGSWSSTGNALEAQAFQAKNAAFTIDDFVPSGTTWQVRSYQTNADKIIRAQGNQAGRARLTDQSSLQATMYPRGIILSTGEDTPEGHSVRARMLIMELSPGDINVQALTKAQANRHQLTGTTAAIIQGLARKPIDIRKKAQAVRDLTLNIGHSRTPSMLGHLVATIEAVIQWATDTNLITPAEGLKYSQQSQDAILKAGEQQSGYLEASDPVDIFTAAIRQVLGANQAHVRTLTGGVPGKANILGWTNESSQSDFPTFKSHGPCIAWIDWDADEIYVDMTSGYNQIRKAAGPEMSLTKQTLMKRLKDAGQLTRIDEGRQRNSIRITAEGHYRTVLAMPISSTLKQEEVPNGK